MDRRLLPKGEQSSHWEKLHIEHRLVSDNGGSFTGGGWKLIWHTTEGQGIESMYRVLRDKRAAPHLLIDFRSRKVIQMLPFDVAARALEHPLGTLETNRANCIQVEICGFAKESQDWSESDYRKLAALATLIEHRVPIQRKVRRTFHSARFVRRFSPGRFVKLSGHMGHQHVPNQPSGHWDPGKLKGRKIVKLMKRY